MCSHAGGWGASTRTGLISLLLGDRNLLWAILLSAALHAVLLLLPLSSPRQPAPARQARTLLVSLEPAAAAEPAPAGKPPRQTSAPPAIAPSPPGLPPRAEATAEPPTATEPPPLPSSAVQRPPAAAAQPAVDAAAFPPTPPGREEGPPLSKPEAPQASPGHARLMSDLRASIVRELVYPLSARRKGVQGEVLVELTLEPSGQASSLSVRRSSGSPTLDRAALRAVKRALPFANALSQPLRLEIPVSFRLSD